MSAFTIAFQVPNLVRALFADSALQGAFVPVFTRAAREGRAQGGVPGRVEPVLPDHARARRAHGAVHPVRRADHVACSRRASTTTRRWRDLTVQLARLMFPIVLLLALSGLVVGMLNSFEHFAVPALAPVAWNLVIIAALVGLVPVMPEGDEIYAYAIGILVGTDRPVPAAAAVAARERGPAHVHDRLARRARAARAQADAAGHDRARADQPQPADQLDLRHARLRPGAGGDRQGVPDLPAAPGPVQRSRRHDPVPDDVALRRPRRARRPAPHDGQRRAPDLPCC